MLNSPVIVKWAKSDKESVIENWFKTYDIVYMHNVQFTSQTNSQMWEHFKEFFEVGSPMKILITCEVCCYFFNFYFSQKMLDAQSYLCFDAECTYNISGKLNYYVYISCKSWIKTNLQKIQKNSKNTAGIQLMFTEGKSLFDYVHVNANDSKGLSNFFFQDWVE